MLKKLLPGICLLLAGVACSANQASSGFLVLVDLNSSNSAFLQGAVQGTTRSASQSICISQSLSEQTNAVVRVLCGTSQFVSISPSPSRRFLGTHGGAFNYVLSPGKTGSDPLSDGISALSKDFYPGTGTVTALRIYNVDGSDGPLEVLLTF